MSYFRNKIVVVTGAGGSIGSEICRQLFAQEIAELRILSLTENGLYNITNELRELSPKIPVIGMLGSVCDRDLAMEICQGADAVIHAAAHKHVPICELNPLAAIDNNVFGTESIAIAAQRRCVTDFVLISSDKAVFPTSIMGATKRAAELVVRRVAAKPIQTRFRIVRFGNVLDSAGSVLPRWREQRRAGKPITLTDPGCIRYFMSTKEAVDLVLSVPPMTANDIGPFVFDMGQPLSMYEVATKFLRELEGEDYHPEVDSDLIEITGLRPGEKLIEELTYGKDLLDTEVPKIKLAVEKPRIPVFRELMQLDTYVQQRQVREAIDSMRGLVALSFPHTENL